MPNYLAGNESNIYAMNRLGSAFTDALVGLAQLKQRQEQLRQQYAMEGQYLDLARQREGREAEMSKATLAERQFDLDTKRKTQERVGNVETAARQMYQPTSVNAQISPFMPEVPAIDPRAIAARDYASNLSALGAMHSPASMAQPQSFAPGSQVYGPGMYPGAQPIAQVPYEMRPVDQQRLAQQRSYQAQQNALGFIRLLAELPGLQARTKLYEAQTEKAGRLTRNEAEAQLFNRKGATSQGTKPMTATNPQTGQKIVSHDGGKTWEPMQ